MLEKMSEFFEARLHGYDEHMLTNIAFAEVFYPFTADCLPHVPNCRILDLGCGTGLELEYYFAKCPTARVTGIDLSKGMLDALRAKFPHKAIDLIQGSYFALPLGIAEYDAAVSVESLHHFTQAEKIPLYAKLHGALKEGGYFILTDYFAYDEEDERALRQMLLMKGGERRVKVVKILIGNSLLRFQCNQVLAVHLFFFVRQRKIVCQHKIPLVF